MKKWKLLTVGILVGCFILLASLRFIKHANRREPVVLDIDRIIQSGTDQPGRLKSVTGVWGDAVVVLGKETRTGYLLLSELNGRVTGVSTTGNSRWTGEFHDGAVTATYSIGPGNKATGTVNLRLSADGSKLTGTWTDARGATGSYSAYRTTQVDKQFLVEHLRARMGGLVQTAD